MNGLYNIYCDESCHLENDGQGVMVLGAVWLPESKKKEIFTRLREIKVKNGLRPWVEVKWNKIAPSQYEFFLEMLNYFFDDDDLHFRVLVVPDKTILDHTTFHQTHDDFYYKMYFDMLKIIISPDAAYNIYLDIKDTRSEDKVRGLKKVLQSSRYDFNGHIIKRVQQVRSHEVEALQLADLLIGAMSYLHRGLTSSESKLRLIERIKKRSSYSLLQNTLPKEEKFNVFIWDNKKKRKNEYSEPF